MVFTNGLMGKYIRDGGRLTICMDRESLHGLMEGVTKESIKMIRSMGLGFIHGRTVDSMPDSGKTDTSMDRGYTKTLLR
jgi:hypothetical protein